MAFIGLTQQHEFDKVLRSLIDMFASRLSNVTDDVR